jgi:hypothetical protein
MNVLVYISKNVSDADKQYLTTLFGLMQNQLNITIASEAPSWKDSFSLIHLVGCWDAKTLYIYNWAVRTHTAVVLSPLGDLNPWHINNLPTAKRLLLNIPIKRMLKQVGVVHVCGQLEYDTLKTFNVNTNIVRIDNPRITSGIEMTDMANQFMRMYRKTLNTWPASMLTTAELELVGLLVLAGIDAEMFTLMDLRNETIEALATSKWSYVLMYAAQERVLDLLRKGLERLQTTTPSTDLSGFETFNFDPIPEDNNDTEDGEDAEVEEIGEDTSSPDNNAVIKTIVENVLTLYNSLSEDTAHLQLLVNLYASLRLSDYDEEALVQALNKARMLQFFRQAEGVMHNLLKLPEGFMPILPLNDKHTTHLTHKITKVFK